MSKFQAEWAVTYYENVIYNELRIEVNVDVGVVEYNYKDENKKTIRKKFRSDFVINRGSNRYYIQSALNVDAKEKHWNGILVEKNGGFI